MKKWEYFYFYEKYNEKTGKQGIEYNNQEGKWVDYPISDKWKIINNLGKEGWELVSIASGISSQYVSYAETDVFTSQYRYFFKREIENNQKGD